MDLELEKMKMKDILDKMTIKEFDDMLERRGINEIKPSSMSEYVECLSKALWETEYTRNSNNFNLDYYDRYNYFELEGQGVA